LDVILTEQASLNETIKIYNFRDSQFNNS
jgi:hypothetical protein